MRADRHGVLPGKRLTPALTLTILLSASPAQAVLEDTESFSAQQYLDFLSRRGDINGVRFWAEKIDSGDTTRPEVVEFFFSSAEFQNNIAPIARLYTAYFLRIPDYEGLQFWIDQFLSGVPLTTISQAFAESPEFIATYGDLDDAAFVTRVYQNVLDRTPDEGGRVFWTEQLQAGLSRGALMVAFSESPEYRSISTNSIQVIMVYVGMLQRSPDQSGFDFWVGKLNDGSSVLNLVGQFLDSAEYAGRFGEGYNAIPEASSLALQSNPAILYFEDDLTGSDADGDALSHELLSASTGPGYYDAHVDEQTGRLFVTLTGSVDSIELSHRAFDGKSFSESAPITITVNKTDAKTAGARAPDLRIYNAATIAYPYADTFSTTDGTPRPPPAIDLSEHFPLPGDQGSQPSSVGWAVAYAAKSYLEKLEIGWPFNRHAHLFSPAALFNQITSADCSGAYIYDALDLLVEQGAVTWAEIPYRDTDCGALPDTEEDLAQAANFKGLRWARLQSVTAIKAALANHDPVIIGLRAFDSMLDLSGPDSVYDEVSGNELGGLAVTLVGYDDDRYGGAFKAINSWGTDWGDNGYFWIAYELTRKDIIQQAYVLYDASNPNTPTPTAATAAPANLPNLQVISWDITYDPRPGGAGQLQYEIANTGAAPAFAGFRVSLIISEDDKFTSSDVIAVSEIISEDLAADTSRFREESTSLPFNIPDTLNDGDYYVALKVDELDLIQESNEADNISPGEDTVTLEQGPADLVINKWHAEWDNFFGDGMFTYEVINRGQEPVTSNWDMNLVLSPDPVVGDENDIFLVFETITGTTDPGESVSKDMPFSIANIVPGDYFVAAWADDLGQVEEINEENNISRAWESGLVSYQFPFPGASQADVQGFSEPVYGKKPQAATLGKIQIGTTAAGSQRIEVLDTQTAPAVSVQLRSQDVRIAPTKRIPLD